MADSKFAIILQKAQREIKMSINSRKFHFVSQKEEQPILLTLVTV